MNLLEITNLSVQLENKEILKDINLNLEEGKLSFLIGRNGAGKSTLSQSVMGDPKYVITSGDIFVKSQSISNENNSDEKISLKELKIEERSKKGIFVSFQNPPEIEGVSLMNFLHTIYVEKFGNEDALSRSTFKFRKHLLSLLLRLNLNSEFLDRSLNVGFSGGEKKRTEILQLLLLKPKIIILDEIDSGLDIYAIKLVEDAIQELIANGSSVLCITHSVDFVKKYPNSQVFLLENGQIKSSGGIEILEQFHD